MTTRAIGSGLAVAALVLAAACSSNAPGTAAPTVSTARRATPSTSAPTERPTTTGSATTVAPTTTVWLCRPGMSGDPCAAPRAATSIDAAGARTVLPASASAIPAVDCFYVYPTVSSEPGDNADLTVQPAERAVAVDQASRFSSVCRVYAPIYRQRTKTSIAAGLGGDPTGDDVAFASLDAAWRDYLAHDNGGRPVAFIGHSQGAAMLIRLLRSEVDPDATLRARLISAIILGGNVTVADGSATGGSFQHIPACTSSTEVGCVIAYSTFPGTPPAGAVFGRPGQGVSLQSGQTATTGVHVLCVNPAAIGGGTGALEPYFLTSTQPLRGVTTPWVTYPGQVSATCASADGATWLQVTAAEIPGDPRPQTAEVQGPLWGFHTVDLNLALGNLVSDVAAEAAAFATSH